jgi:hypothetical protein
MTLAYYLICNSLPVVRQSLSASQSVGSGKIEGTGQLLTWLSALFPDFSRVDYKLYVITGETLPDFSLLFSQYGVLCLYVALALWFACMVYRRRDLK